MGLSVYHTLVVHVVWGELVIEDWPVYLQGAGPAPLWQGALLLHVHTSPSPRSQRRGSSCLEGTVQYQIHTAWTTSTPWFWQHWLVSSLSLSLSVCLFVCPSVCFFVSLFVRLSLFNVFFSLFLFPYHSHHFLFIWLADGLSICLSVMNGVHCIALGAK